MRTACCSLSQKVRDPRFPTCFCIACSVYRSRSLTSTNLEGRLSEAALNLLQGADVQFRRENRSDIALVKNLPIALIFLPAADIPTFVGQGQIDLGITGWDQVKEHDASVRPVAGASDEAESTPGCDMVMELGFGSCKLQVQTPGKGKHANGKDLIGKTVATSFVNLTTEYFARLEAEQAGESASSTSTRKLQTKVVTLSGSVETACALGLADGIVDLVGKSSLPIQNLYHYDKIF